MSRPGSDENYSKLPKVERGEIRILWADDYYDGPLSGMCLFKERMYYYHCVDDIGAHEEQAENSWYRRYGLVELTNDEIKEAKARHALFRKYVGTHCDYDESGKGTCGITRPQKGWAGYYDKEKEWPELGYMSREATVWYEE